MQSIFIGAGPPYVLTFEISNDDPDIDLTSVTAAEFAVKLPPDEDGEREETTWTADIDLPSQSATYIKLKHAHDPDELVLPGEYILEPRFTTGGGGALRAQPRQFVATEAFGL